VIFHPPIHGRVELLILGSVLFPKRRPVRLSAESSESVQKNAKTLLGGEIQWIYNTISEYDRHMMGMYCGQYWDIQHNMEHNS
jgi:hypothetical protein